VPPHEFPGFTDDLRPSSEAGTRWGRFIVSYGVQSLVMAVFIITAIAHPEVLTLPVHDYHFIGMVSIPAPVPQAPAPVRDFPRSQGRATGNAAARSHGASPPNWSRKNRPFRKSRHRKWTLRQKKNLARREARSRPPVKTNVFSNGSSATPTMAAAPQKVQTGGFGDPNGVPGSDPHGRPVTIAQAGSFDMPSAPAMATARAARTAQRESSPALVLAARRHWQ